MKDPTRPDLLARYDALGFPSARKFESKHHLPENIIGKMKLGLNSSSASRVHHDRLADAISREEQGLEAAPPDKKAGRPPLIETLSEDDALARTQLEQAVEDAADMDAVDMAGRKTAAALLRGVVTDTTARVLKELLGERRQAIKARLEQEEKAKAGSEMVIRVVYVRNWTGGPLPKEGQQ